jgi:hypothetical protein
MTNTKIRITFEGNVTREYEVENEVGDQLLAGCTKLSETRAFKDTGHRRHAVMMANVLEIEEIFPTRGW